MADFIDKLLGWLKTSPQILLAISLISAGLLFLKGDTIAILGLEDFRTQYRTYIGLIFLTSTAFFVSYPINKLFILIYSWITTKYNQHSQKKRYIEWLKHLTPSQKNILREYIKNNTRTLKLDFTDGTVNELMNAGILYLPSNLSIFDSRPRSGGMFTAYNIQPWIFKYLIENQHILDN